MIGRAEAPSAAGRERPWRRRFEQRWLWLLPVAVFLALFLAWPLSLVLREAVSADAWHWLAGDFARSRIATALLQGFLSLLLTVALAVPIALLHHKRAVPGSRLLLAVQAAPFVLPVFVVVGGLREILGRDGWLDGLVGVDVLSTIGPLGAVVVANAYYNTGLAARLFHAALERRPRRIEDAAATLGATPSGVAWRITIPLLLPAFLATALLVLLFCLGSFGVVLLLGEGRIDTLDTLLYSNLRGAFPREDRGAVLAVVQIALQATLLAACLFLERRSARFASHDRAAKPRAGPVAATVAWSAAAIAVLPALAVLVGGFRLAGRWSLRPWRTLLDAEAPGHVYGFDLARAAGWSLAYAAMAVAGALALTACLAYATRQGRGVALAEPVAMLPLGTSSVVLGFGFLLAFTGRTWLPLFGSPVIVVAAHTLLAFPFAARVLVPALRSLDTRLDDAAATLGARPWQVAWRIHRPLLAQPLAVAAGFAAALSLGDYGASLLLMTDDIAALSVWTGRHGGPGAFDPLARAQSTALAGFLLVVTVAVIVALEAVALRRPLRARSPREGPPA